MHLARLGKSLELTKNHTGLFKMNKRAIEVLDGEYYIDMNKKPCKTIWEAAKTNNKRPLKVRRHVCRDDSVFTSL